MTTNVINVNCGAPSWAPEGGTPITREYSPRTTLADRHNRRWLVTSYRTSAFLDGTPPFEARDLGWVWAQHGPLTVVDGGAHSMFHTRPQPGCPNCPSRGCWCERPKCTDYDTCRRNEAGSETAWRVAT